MKATIFYYLILLLVVIFSYGFVDPNIPFINLREYFRWTHEYRSATTVLYGSLVIMLFGFYFWVLRQIKRGEVGVRHVWKLIWITVIILFFSYPAAFTYDIYNYIATAKVTYLYHENPYLVMPIEIPSEPSLAYMHAANKVALYGGSWILLTAIPHFVGLGNPILTLAAFKLIIAVFFLVLLRQIYSLSKNNPWALAFFGLNPLVIVESLISAHNDVVMMVFALGAFLSVQKKRYLLSFVLLIVSIFIKYATIFLLPLYIYVVWKSHKGKSIDWPHIWNIAAICMLGAFLLSPLREELYPWYFLWVLPFVALIPSGGLLTYLSLAFSFGLMFRVVPYLYTWRWDGITPMVKRIVSFVPPILVSLWYGFKKD